MTNEQINLVKKSFAKIEPIAETAADLFYTRLFELDPGLRRLFKGNMKEQGRKLMNMIGLAVKGIDRIDELAPTIQMLGIRHSNYGVKDQHYETVADALLWTLEKGLGEDFTNETETAWTEVYMLLTQTMKDAVNQQIVGESAYQSV